MNGYLIGVLGGLFLSTDSIIIKLMAINNSWLIAMLRGFLMWVTVFILYFTLPQYRNLIGKPWITRKNLWPIIFFCCASACFINAINLGNIATVLVIISATPFMSAIMSCIFFRERMDYSSLLVALVGLLGVLIVMEGNALSQNYIANLYGLITAIFMSFAFIFSARVGTGMISLPAVGGLLSSVVILLFFGFDLLPICQNLTSS